MTTLIKSTVLSFTLFASLACNSKTKEPKIAFGNTTKTAITKYNKPYIKVALLLDTSNSMDGLINQAKAQLWDIVNELSYAKCKNDKPNLQIALYEYGNDNLNGDEGYIRQVLAFSEDLDDISKELFSLTTNGGNEYCGQALQTSINQLNWGSNPDDLKLIFIAGNEPFTQGRVNYKHAATNAKDKDITVNTIFCGDYNQGISSYWKDGAQLTNGDYMAINHNRKTVHIATPYDDDILILNEKLNKTYVSYGTKGYSKLALQTEQDNNANSYSKANAVKRTISKSSHFYKNKSWDLVDAIEENEVDIKNLNDEVLPQELKGKSESEIITYIETKRNNREKIQKEIKALNAKRTEYISKLQKQETNGLESAMIKAIKEQAKIKSYQW
ncbi:vWA domain-containing protein [Neotamlana laminarinivorans]|uniref:VWA domain-containing protein n=1 Tax=Neotamlana laminarinivorans TaxID=2883124 RepID=A0A9X1L206_9FLAO|nr:vWA domain-containing protein [Tamlana laminarinivorans]MCB4799303.1 VWA domain-containing protein [Tamlana laminarinivorans]